MMKRIAMLGGLAIVGAGLCLGAELDNVRQVSKGGQSSDSSWSPDGTRLIFQATRDGNECDQIYIMDADGSNVRMVSTGKGVASFGRFMPDGEHIIYASTHESSDACPLPQDRNKRHLSRVPAGYDIFVADTDGEGLKKLTTEPGYDGEAAVHRDTGRITYTSVASGDLAVWSMDVGGEKRSKLTTAEGYDGRATLSPDGAMLVYQAYHPLSPDGLAQYRELLGRSLLSLAKSELFVSDAYGMGARQITNTGCAATAPQFTPSGKQIVFSSDMNSCGSGEFELFIVNADGSGLEQLTRYYEFTSFPAFSPDGKKITFTSSRDAEIRNDTNIFVADWVE